jgi:hypothetical protein
MKKELHKIAIVYDKANWKTTTKIAVDYLRSKDDEVVMRKDDMCFNGSHDKLELYLCNHGMSYKWNKWEYLNANQSMLSREGFTVLTMPQDFDKLKSYFDEDVKDGDVWVFSDNGDDRLWLCRFKDQDMVINYYSLINEGNKLLVDSWMDLASTNRKATPEEEAKLIEAEHANGYHWDGKELVEIPEYVNTSEWGIRKIIFSSYNACFYNDDKDHCIGYQYAIINPSTKEAFAAQNKPNKIFTCDDVEAIKSAFDKETSKLRSRLNKKSERIKQLEEENEKLLKSIELVKREGERFEKKLHAVKFDINEFLKG